jgi:hypothetical protein
MRGKVKVEGEIWSFFWGVNYTKIVQKQARAGIFCHHLLGNRLAGLAVG